MATVTIAQPHPILLAGRWVDSPDPLRRHQPGRPGNPAGATYHATEAQYEEAVTAAVAAFEETRRLPAYERGRILRAISAGIAARREELGALICREAGKPIRDALVEVDRAVLTFRLGAEEAERMTGETIPLDLMPASRGRLGITRRFPIGPVAAISPFNFPLNLAAHKLAPAIAAGCSIVLKPPSKDPLTMLTVGEIVAEAGLPAGRGQHPADDPRARRPDGRGRAVQAADVHRLAVGRLADEGPGRQEEGRARARRQRRGHRRPERRPRLGRPADPRRRVRLRRPGLHQRPADVRPRGRLGRVHGEVRRGRPGPQARRPGGPADRPRADGRRGGRRRGPSAGSTRRSRSAASSSSAARPTGRSSRRRS